MSMGIMPVVQRTMGSEVDKWIYGQLFRIYGH